MPHTNLHTALEQNRLPKGSLTPKRWRIRIPWGFLIILAFIAINFIIMSVAIVQVVYATEIRAEPTQIPELPVAIVLGAAIREDGTASDALNDRLQTAIDLYERGTVEKLLMTGDDGKRHADEVSVMARTAEEAGVPMEDIWIDGHGYRTYESCKRAISEFNITHAVVITQRFHLPRAVFLCNQLGIDTVGLVADKQEYERGSYFRARDLLASVKAFWDIFIKEPKPPVTY